MALKYDAAVTDLLCRLDSLEKLYREGYATGEDMKLLQGVERCIELRMKLLGYDGKTVVAAPAAVDRVISIDLKRLSDDTLREILTLTNNK